MTRSVAKTFGWDMSMISFVAIWRRMRTARLRLASLRIYLALILAAAVR